MRSWIFSLTVLVVLLFFETAFAQSAPIEEILLPSLKQTDAEGLATVHADEEAKTFFSTRLRETFGLKNIMPELSVGPPSKSKTSQTQSPHLTGWRLVAGS